MIVRYGDAHFDFEPSEPRSLAGYLKLNEEQKKLLATLIASEEEDRYLDSNGERLPSDELL